MITAITRARSPASLSALSRATRRREERAEAAVHPTVAANTVTVAPQAFTETLGAIGTVVVARRARGDFERAGGRGASRTFS